MEKIILFFLKIQTAFAQTPGGGGTSQTGGGGTPQTGGGGFPQTGGGGFPQTGGGGTNPVPLVDPLQGKGLTEIIANITNFLVFKVATPLVTVLIIIGALQMILAGGNAEKIQTGKKTILYTVIGFVIVLLASGVATLIKNIVTGGS